MSDYAPSNLRPNGRRPLGRRKAPSPGPSEVSGGGFEPATPLRAAGVCGLLTLVTLSVGWIGGVLAQPDAYSSADDDLSDLGALTANKACISNQIGDNLSGVPVIPLGLGLWRALSPDVLGRIGAGAVMLTGLTVLLEGFFRLDCRGIDPGCTHESWDAPAPKMKNR